LVLIYQIIALATVVLKNSCCSLRLLLCPLFALGIANNFVALRAIIGHRLNTILFWIVFAIWVTSRVIVVHAIRTGLLYTALLWVTAVSYFTTLQLASSPSQSSPFGPNDCRSRNNVATGWNLASLSSCCVVSTKIICTNVHRPYLFPFLPWRAWEHVHCSFTCNRTLVRKYFGLTHQYRWIVLASCVAPFR
jgi:hypothetical protein